jgi:hypothetical protein
MGARRVRGIAAGGRRGRLGLACGISLLALVMAAGAFASTLNSVVQPTGSVAGRAYPYWLQSAWRSYFTSSAACHTTKVGGRTVTLVVNAAGGRSSCHAPAHQPIYVNGFSTECSTIPGHHNGWGTSDSQLQKCSRTVTERALITEWLDGRRVPNYGRTFWKTVRAFGVTVPANRFKGFHGGQARAAAWGWSLLLKSLPKGTHTVRCKATYPNGKLEFQSRVTLYVG